MAYAAGDIINFPYTGAAQAVTLTPGLYKLEVSLSNTVVANCETVGV